MLFYGTLDTAQCTHKAPLLCVTDSMLRGKIEFIDFFQNG